MKERVDVLSYTYEHLYQTDWQSAISDVFIGRAEILEEHEDVYIGIVEGRLPMPKVVRFKTGISPSKLIARKQVRFSKDALYSRDEGHCQYCEKSLTRGESTVDHVTPRSKGGVTSWENCVLCCSSCNSKKSNLTPQEAGMRLLKSPVRPKATHCVRIKR